MRPITFLIAVLAAAPYTTAAAQGEKPRPWTFTIGGGSSPFNADAFSQDMHYNDAFDDYFINPDQDQRTSVASVMMGVGRSFLRRGSLALDANLNLNLLLNFPMTGLVLEIATGPRWSVTQNLQLFGMLAGGFSAVSGKVGTVPRGNNTGADIMLSPIGKETAPVGSSFNMEGYSLGGSVAGGINLMITPRFGLQGNLTYRAYGDIDNWTIKVKDVDVDGETVELFEMEMADFESDGEPGAIGIGGLAFGFNLVFSF